MMNDDELTRIAKECLSLEEVRANFTGFTDLKIIWTRIGMHTISLYISDYLQDLPRGCIRDVLITLDGKMRGLETEYPPALVELLTSEEFRRENLPKRMMRMVSRGVSYDGTPYNARLDKVAAKIELPPGITIGCSKWAEDQPIQSSYLFKDMVFDKTSEKLSDELLAKLMLISARVMEEGTLNGRTTQIRDRIKEEVLDDNDKDELTKLYGGY